MDKKHSKEGLQLTLAELLTELGVDVVVEALRQELKPWDRKRLTWAGGPEWSYHPPYNFNL